MNGSVAKASRSVAVGDVIVIQTRDAVRSIEVLKIPTSKQVSKGEARELTSETRHTSSDSI